MSIASSMPTINASYSTLLLDWGSDMLYGYLNMLPCGVTNIKPILPCIICNPSGLVGFIDEAPSK